MSNGGKQSAGGCARYAIHTVLGAPIAFLISVPLMGGIEEAAIIIGLAVVCTAGVSLVVIIPVCAAVGSVAALIFRAAFPGNGSPGAKSGGGPLKTPRWTPSRWPLPTNPMGTAMTPAMLQRDCLAIAEYLRKSVASGRPESEAVKALVVEGWSEENIQDAQDYLGLTASGGPPPLPE